METSAQLTSGKAKHIILLHCKRLGIIEEINRLMPLKVLEIEGEDSYGKIAKLESDLLDIEGLLKEATKGIIILGEDCGISDITDIIILGDDCGIED